MNISRDFIAIAKERDELRAEVEHLRAYQQQMNDILIENASLRNELTVVRLERDRLKHSRDALAYLHYGHYMVQRTRKSIQADIEACESALTALRRELATLSGHPSGNP